MSGPYGSAALTYADAGWRGVLWVPPKAKWPPPEGYTGHDGADPSYADIHAWATDGYAGHNIVLRLPDDVIGIDVDCYDDKQGAKTLAEHVAIWGPLPPTWESGSRDDGSAIKWYRVPAGMKWPSVLGDGIEIIQRTHRYAMVWPSIHPNGGQYGWRDPAGPTTEIPRPEDVTDLPQRWVDGMTSELGDRPSSYTNPDRAALIEHGIPGGQNQHEMLRDVVWDLCRKGTDRADAYGIWLAITDPAKTKLTRPREPWTKKHFDELWDTADRKQAPGLTPFDYEPPSNGDDTQDDRSSWSPIDLGPLLDGTRPRPQPTILTRTDGQGLWYPGRTHALVGESEAAKSWIAQYGCAQQLLAGHAVAYLDFEDSDGGVTDRMLTLGMTPALLRDLFGYIAPEEPIDRARRSELAQALGDLKPTLVIIDGVTEAMSLHKLKSIDNDDLATFGRLITRPIAATGSAVVNLDHQPKATDNRGRYALGGVHKLNGLSGVSIIAENIEPMGVGLHGVTRLRIAKDRPGQLRAHGLPSAGLRWIGDFILDTGILEEPAWIRPPVEVAKVAEDWRPTEVMRMVCDAMTKAYKPLPATGIYDRVKARANITRRALAILVDEKYVEETPGPRGAKLHTLIKPYQGDTDE
jgi:Bifunctional DNA primase/polymerase, N-terminal/AAA domain